MAARGGDFGPVLPAAKLLLGQTTRRAPSPTYELLQIRTDKRAYHLKPSSMGMEALVADVAPRASGATQPTSYHLWTQGVSLR